MRSSLFVAVIALSPALFTAGCDVGDITARVGGGADATLAGTPDGTPAVGPDAAPAAGGDASTLTCRNPVTTQASGQHNPGTTCMSCHGAGGNAPRFTMGGTLYATAAGGAPVVGATITVRDASGQSIDVVSAQNGNFWIVQAVTYPVTVYASSCPTVQPMIATSATGDCNSCHAAGVGPGTVHLP
jgi:cytochrome c553